MTQDIYTDYAERALEAARESMFIRWSEDRVGVTHAPALGAEIGGDALGESNLHTATELLAEHIASGTITEDTIGRSGRTWMRMLTFTVYDDEGNITQAWRDAVDLVFVPLADYPILDEDDYYEREYANFVAEIDFMYGAAGDAVRRALAEAGIFRLDDVDADGVIRLLDESIQSGQELSDEEASALGHTVRQFRARHADEALPALDRLVPVPA